MALTLTPEQHKALTDIIDTVRQVQGTGAVTYDALHKVCLANAEEMPNEVLVCAHELVWTEYEKDNSLGLLRAVLSALSIVHYRRFVAALADIPAHALLDVWENDTTDETLDPVRLERNAASAYERVVTDRLVEDKPLTDPVWDALDKIPETFPDVDGEELPARLVRYKAHEIAALRALLTN